MILIVVIMSGLVLSNFCMFYGSDYEWDCNFMNIDDDDDYYYFCFWWELFGQLMFFFVVDVCFVFCLCFIGWNFVVYNIFGVIDFNRGYSFFFIKYYFCFCCSWKGNFIFKFDVILVNVGGFMCQFYYDFVGNFYEGLI